MREVELRLQESVACYICRVRLGWQSMMRFKLIMFSLNRVLPADFCFSLFNYCTVKNDSSSFCPHLVLKEASTLQ